MTVILNTSDNVRKIWMYTKWTEASLIELSMCVLHIHGQKAYNNISDEHSEVDILSNNTEKLLISTRVDKI